MLQEYKLNDETVTLDSLPMRRVNGLHHITAIAGPAQENLDFYAGVLGMRLGRGSTEIDDNHGKRVG